MVKSRFDLVNVVVKTDKNPFLCIKIISQNNNIHKNKLLKNKYLHITLLLIILSTILLPAQTSTKSSTPIRKAAEQVSKKLAEPTPDEEMLAEDYVRLAKELNDKKEYNKAEEYWNKALQLYTKLHQKEKIAETIRELAKIQEITGNAEKAVQLYEAAAQNSTNQTIIALNRNDVQRLKNTNNPQAQSEYIEKKIQLLKANKKEEDPVNKEVAQAYTQMADVNVQMNRNQLALENYETALKNVSDKAPEAFNIQRKIAEVYLNEQQPEKGIKTLDEVYKMALTENNTIEATRSLEQLTREYHKQGKDKQALVLYQDFLQHLEQLIQSDSSLVDAKTFQSTEEKIIQLEKEKALKDALISKKNSLNNVLLWFIVLMSVFLFLLGITLRSINIRNKKIALQSLRREMNPHFIFNSLNSVNQFIAQNDEVAANKYLASYSRLMRNTMENSNKDFIRLDRELILLKEYLELEHLRFGDKFTYTISINKSVEPETLYVPGMLVQPYLENAIWHGLRYKEGQGLLQLSVCLTDKTLCIIVDDNGIGLTKSQSLKTANQKVHQSRGLSNINERIKLLREIYKKSIIVKIAEKTAPENGVQVSIYLPLIHHLKA